jgi:competence protein ComEA
LTLVANATHVTQMTHMTHGPAAMRRLLASLLCALAGPALALDVNQASAAELDSLRGVGPGLSTPLLAERDKAAFKDWADLIARVKGLGPGNAARLSAQGLTVDGAAYQRPAKAAPAPR